MCNVRWYLLTERYVSQHICVYARFPHHYFSSLTSSAAALHG